MIYLTNFFSYFSGIFSEFIEKIIELKDVPQNLLSIMGEPLTLLAILGCVLIFIVLINIRKIKIDSKMITRIAISLALTCIIGMIRLYHFPQGGSITPGRFIPIFIIAFMYGSEIGLFTGLIYGILDFILGPYIVSPIQVLFDYPLAFMMLGLAGLFYKKTVSDFKSTKLRMCLGITIGTLGRMLCSVISGVAFFGEYAPAGTSPLVYSLSVNVPVVGIEGLICIVLAIILPIETIIKKAN